MLFTEMHLIYLSASDWLYLLYFGISTQFQMILQHCKGRQSGPTGKENVAIMD